MDPMGVKFQGCTVFKKIHTPSHLPDTIPRDLPQPRPQKAVNVDIIELAGMLRGFDTMDAEGWLFGWLVGCLVVWLFVCLVVWIVRLIV